MPQEWTKFWQADLGPKAFEYAPLINKLPNLTLLTNKLNPKVSNREFSYKKVEIQKDSRLAIDKVFNDHEAYDDDFIEERAKLIFENIDNLFNNQ